MGVFIGRRIELGRWVEILTAPDAHCVLVIGQEGMGKSTLVNEMARVARDHAEVSCGAIHYTVAPTDTVESLIAQMINDAFDAANHEESSFTPTERRRKQWHGLISLIPRGNQLLDLLKSLRFDASRNPRQQLLERLSLVSDAIPAHGRIVFVIDAEKYLHPASADAWRLVMRELPAKCKFVFAQRSDDILANDAVLCSLSHVVRIPDTGLGVLTAANVRELVEQKLSPRQQFDELVQCVEKYQGHPYAVSAALDMIADGKLDASELPTDPTPYGLAKEQWKKICQKGPDAVRFFAALSVLGVNVPYDVLLDVAGCSPETISSLTSENYLKGLIRHESDSYSVYHSILSEYINWDSGLSVNEYHARAVDAYRSRLLILESAPLRLPQHLRQLGGDAGYVQGVLECVPALLNRGQTQTSIGMLEEAVALVVHGSPDFRDLEATRANVLANLGQFSDAENIFSELLPLFSDTDQGLPILLTDLAWIRLSRGEAKAAEIDVKRALPIFEQRGVNQGIARCLKMLGEISETEGDYSKAEDYFRQANERADEPMSRGVSLMSFANSRARRGEIEEAIQCYEQARRDFTAVGYREGVADAIGRLGRLFSISGDFDRAITLHREALQMEVELGHHLRIAEEYHALGDAFLNQDDLEVAKHNLDHALELARGVGAPTMLAKIYSSLATIHHRQGELNRALFLCESALSIFKQVNDVQAVAVERCNLAAIHITLGRYPDAERNYARVLSSISAVELPSTFAFALGNLGVIYRETGRLQEANDAHNRALELYRRIGDPVNGAIQQQLLGMLSATRGHRTDAIGALKEALSVFQKHGVQDRVRVVERLLRNLEA